MQAVACQYLEHLNISRCYALTDAGIAALSTAPAVTLGRCAAEDRIPHLLLLYLQRSDAL